ncbi:MAG: hypothetical protein JKY55_17270 [Aliivibrio sp.]|uniref:hypothetical protein n=1 Tax=Aliivibrio sp. TaxID=1872443 RepID=UPI001A5F70A6|nr:hypothetical protein [Aliivibrio sp.]
MNEMNDTEFKEQVEKGLQQAKYKSSFNKLPPNNNEPPNESSELNNVASIFGRCNINHFNYKSTIFYGNFPEPELPKVTQRQAGELLRLVKSMVKWEQRVNPQPKPYSVICAELKDKFTFSEYETLPASEYLNAVAYLEQKIGRLANEFMN